MKKLLIGLFLLSSTLFGQIEGVFSNFFKYSTIYAGFNLSSPMYQEDRYIKKILKISRQTKHVSRTNKTTTKPAPIFKPLYNKKKRKQKLDVP